MEIFIGAALFFWAGTSYDKMRLVYLDEMGGKSQVPVTYIVNSCEIRFEHT